MVLIFSHFSSWHVPRKFVHRAPQRSSGDEVVLEVVPDTRQRGWCLANRRLRDKTNGCYGLPSSPGAAGDHPATAECLTTAGRSRRPSGTPGGRTSRKNYIKKPLNAFMLFMKEMRQRVIDECTLKESAAINQILGRKVCGVHVNV